MFFQSNSGVLQVVIGEPPSNAPYASGYSFINQERMYVIPWDAAAPMPSDTVYSGGLARTAKGALYVVEGTPSAAEKSLGVPARTIRGVAYVTTGAVGQGSTFTAPWGMVSSLGQIHIDASFGLGFADLGAGVVSIVAGISGATPTFTRATAATTVLSNGLVKTDVASGSPRSYYDPTTLTYLGYLAEGARTNLLLHSADITNAAWTKVDVTPTLSGVGITGGSNTANLITEGSAGTASTSQAVTATADVNYAVSFWIKTGNTPFVQLRVFNAGNAFRTWINTTTGVLSNSGATGTGALVSATTKAYVNGFYRVELVGSVGSGATAISVQFLSADSSGSSTRVANATYSVDGFQFENNVSFASSYIATVGTTVTRNADQLSYPGTGWLSQTVGTLFAQGFFLTGTSGTQVLASINDGTSNERMHLRRNGGNAQWQVIDGGAQQAIPLNAAIADATVAKVAGAYAVNSFQGALNGVQGTEDTSGTLPTTTQLEVGMESGAQPFSPIRRVAYWPQRLSNAQLQGIST